MDTPETLEAVDVVSERDSTESSCPSRTRSITAPGRVHLGLFQLSDSFTVMNMGAGFAIERPRWCLRVTRSAIQDHITCAEGITLNDELLSASVELLGKLSRLSWFPPVEIEVTDAIPSHAGLGSKTALLCGLLRAKTIFTHTPAAWPSLRRLTGRGGTSGIGVNTAVQGGFIIDSGHREPANARKFGPSSTRGDRQIPNVVARWRLPRWPLLLAMASGARRCFGDREKAFFQGTLPLALSDAQQVAATVLFQLIPAVATTNYEDFVEALNRLQRVGFKQREWELQDDTVKALRQAALGAGADCVALSSVGPTVAIFCRDLDAVTNAIYKRAPNGLTVWGTVPRNRGIGVQRT